MSNKLKIPEYDNYNNEKRIALLDNSAVSFMLKLDNKGHKPDTLLQGYDVIFLPEWVVEEIQDSEFRVQYIERLVKAGIPIRIIKEILSEIFSWYYTDTEILTIYTQDSDSYDFQTCAEKLLKKEENFKNTAHVSVTYRSNDSILCQMYRDKQLTIEEIKNIRDGARNVVYTLMREDNTVAFVTEVLNNEEFAKLIQNESTQIIF